MSIRELQDTLRAHADTIDDLGQVARGPAARRRASVVRRRQALVVAGVAAVVLPLTWFATLGVNPLDRTAPPVVTPPEPSPTLFVDAFAGRTLIDSESATGESELVFSADVSRNTEWRAVCDGVGSDYTLHLALDDGEPGELPCDVELVSGRWIGYQLGPDYPEDAEHTLRVWLTRTSDGAQVAPPDGSIGAAVYSLPEPAATVAGHQVQELEADGTHEYRLTEHEESAPGDRDLSSTYVAGDVPVEVDWYTSGSGGSTVQVYVDGEPETSLLLGEGGPGLVLAPGGSHTLRMRILGEVAPDALLGFVWREEAS